MHMNNGHFTLGVKAKVEFKSSIPIGAIIKIAPTTLHLESRPRWEFKSSIPIGAIIEKAPTNLH
jgi:hypothetical protein